MSSLIVAGDTSGTVTLQAPAIAGTTILTLPAVSGTIVTTTGGNATSTTNISDGIAGNIPYQSLPGVTAFVTNGTSGQFLQSAGSGTPVWAAAGASVVRSTKTANYTLVAGDKGNLVVATANTFTFAFTAAATLGDGWFVYLQNSGTGDITLDPNASETIDGLTSYIMYPGEVRLVQCDGAGFNTVVLNTFSQTFTASGTFIRPPGYSQFSGLLWGGGGGGGRSSGFGVGGGGGGACCPFILNSASVSSSQSFTLGAGGNGSSTIGSSASVGGASTFITVTAFGGGGGGGGASADSNGGGGGGVLSAGGNGSPDNNQGGGNGGRPSITSVASTGPAFDNSGFGGAYSFFGDAGRAAYGGGAGNSFSTGGASIYGGGGGGGGTTTARAGGASIFGGAGGSSRNGSVGDNGSAPAGGGGGSYNGSAGGNGGRGELRIWGII